MALTIEDLLNMQVAPRQAISADVPGILAAMMANRQQGMPELPNMPAPIQPIALPSLGDGGGHGGGGAGLAQQAISSLMGEYFQSRADEKQTKAESEQAKLLAQYAPQLYDERILAEKDPRAAAQLKADRAAFASGNPILAKTGVKNYEAYLTSRMPDINASETIKNVRAQGYDLGTPEFQAGMKQEMQQKNAPTGMYRNERGELAFSPLAGGGTYQDVIDRMKPAERARLAIEQAREQRAIEESKIDKEPLVQVSGPDGLPMWVKRSEAEGKQAYSPTGIANKPLPVKVVESLTKLEAVKENTDRLNATFKPEFGGHTVTGDYSNTAGRIFGDETGQSQWWQDYQTKKNQVRNTMFGVALTPTETNEWEKSDVNPRMEAGQIQKNLARQAEIEDRGYERLRNNYQKGGYDTSEFALGDTPKRPQLTPEQALEMLKKNGARFQ